MERLYDESDVQNIFIFGDISYNESTKEFEYKGSKYSKVDILDIFVKETKKQEKEFQFYSTNYSDSDAEKLLCELKLKELELTVSNTEKYIEFIVNDGKIEGSVTKYKIIKKLWKLL